MNKCVVCCTTSWRGAESRVICIKVMQLNDKLFSRVNIVIFLILRYFLYLRDVPKLYI
jgi:hypothetical protein